MVLSGIILRTVGFEMPHSTQRMTKTVIAFKNAAEKLTNFMNDAQFMERVDCVWLVENLHVTQLKI